MSLGGRIGKFGEYIALSVSALALIAAFLGLTSSIGSYIAARAGWLDLVQAQSTDAKGVYSQLAQLDEMTLRLVVIGEQPACEVVTCGNVGEERADAMSGDALSYKQSVDAKGFNAFSLGISTLALIVAMYAIGHPHFVTWLSKRRANAAATRR